MVDLAALLSRRELERAEAFVRPVDRRRAVVSRGVLRLLLARTLGAREPRDLPLDTEARGRPRLAGAPPFSLSHCDGLTLIAFAAAGQVGVDVERVDAGEAWRDLSARLHPHERRALADARARDRGRTFLRLWTRKEAMAKALGLGMFALDPALWTTPCGPPGASEAGPWSFADMTPARGVVGALAASAQARLQRWTFAPET